MRPDEQEPIDNHFQNSGNIEIEPGQLLGIMLMATYWYERIAPSRIMLLSGQRARAHFGNLGTFYNNSYMFHLGRIFKTSLQHIM